MSSTKISPTSPPGRPPPWWHPHRAFYRFVVVFFTAFMSFGGYFAYDCVGVVQLEMQAALHIDDAGFGLLYSVYSFPNMVLPFFCGILIDKIGVRKGTIGCLFIAFFGQGLLVLGVYGGLSWAFPVMLVGRFLFGVGAEASYVAQNSIVCSWFRDKEMALAMGLTVSAGRLGSFFTFNATSAVVAWSGNYSSALWLGLAATALSLLCGLIFVVLDIAADSIAGAGAKTEGETISLKFLRAFPVGFYLAALISALYYAVVFPFQSTATALFEEQFGYTQSQAAALISILPLSSMVCAPIFGWIVDRLGRRIWMVIAGTAILVPSFIMVLSVHVPPPVVCVFVGLAYSLVPAALWPCVPMLIRQEHVSTAFGLMSCLINIGLTVIYPVLGWLKSLDPSAVLPMATYSGLAGLGVVLALGWLVADIRTGSVCNRSEWRRVTVMAAPAAENEHAHENEHASDYLPFDEPTRSKNDSGIDSDGDDGDRGTVSSEFRVGGNISSDVQVGVAVDDSNQQENGKLVSV